MDLLNFCRGSRQGTPTRDPRRCCRQGSWTIGSYLDPWCLARIHDVDETGVTQADHVRAQANNGPEATMQLDQGDLRMPSPPAVDTPEVGDASKERTRHLTERRPPVGPDAGGHEGDHNERGHGGHASGETLREKKGDNRIHGCFWGGNTSESTRQKGKGRKTTNDESCHPLLPSSCLAVPDGPSRSRTPPALCSSHHLPPLTCQPMRAHGDPRR